MTELLQEALYSNHSIPEVLEHYEDLLRRTGDLKNLAHATKLSEYRNIISTKKHSSLRKVFDGFYNLLVKEYPDLRFRIAGRRKSLMSLEKKICRNLESNISLEAIRDLLGVRIIVFDDNPDICYKVLELFIKYCLNEEYTICNVNDKPTSFDSELLNHFNYGIKDYISNPKGNGYQSLHAVFKNVAGFNFEVQIRTFDMHVEASVGDSRHSDYKNEKYQPLDFDKSQINIPGYKATPNGELLDLVGLEYSVEIIQRNKSF